MKTLLMLLVLCSTAHAVQPVYHGTETEVCTQMLKNVEFHPWLKGARNEWRLWDKTRVDFYTPTHAVEVDWARKWAEGIGQSLYYADVTGRKPGLCLLVEQDGSDSRYVYRAQTVCVKRDIKIWLVLVNKKGPTPAPRLHNVPEELPPPARPAGVPPGRAADGFTPRGQQNELKFNDTDMALLPPHLANGTFEQVAYVVHAKGQGESEGGGVEQGGSVRGPCDGSQDGFTLGPNGGHAGCENGSCRLPRRTTGPQAGRQGSTIVAPPECNATGCHFQPWMVPQTRAGVPSSEQVQIHIRWGNCPQPGRSNCPSWRTTEGQFQAVPCPCPRGRRGRTLRRGWRTAR